MIALPLAVSALEWAFPGSAEPFLRVSHLDLAPGQVLAVTGPSGAGKSTFLHLLAGLETPHGGAVLWDGQDWWKGSPSLRDRRRRSLGLVFQDFQLVPELSALENVLLPLTFVKWSVPRFERTRAAELLERLGVRRLSARAGTLSRGEMQRTALARAVFTRPGALLADEPTASLDPANENAVTDLLVDYGRQHGATVIVATHQTGLQERADLRVRFDHGLMIQEPL